MRIELQELLESAGYCVPNGGDLRDYAILVRTVDGVPANPARPIGFVPTGFQLVLLGENRRPTHHVRCQAPDHEGFARECSLLDVLCSDPQLAKLLPPSRSAFSPLLRVQVAKYLGAKHFDPRDVSTWVRSAAEVARIRNRLCERAGELVPELLGGRAEVRLGEEASDALETIRQRGILSRSQCVSVENVFRSAPALPCRLQHGDFWGENLIWHDRTWWIIDFSGFGAVRVPCYDLFQLIDSSARTGRRWGQGWGWMGIAPGNTPPAFLRAWRSLLDHQAGTLQLSPSDLGALLVFYLLRKSAHQLGVGRPPSFAEAALCDLRAVADALGRSTPLEGLLPW